MWFTGKKDNDGEKQYAAGMARLNEKSPRADQAAFANFSKAAQLGHIEAILELGFSYFKGRGVERSEDKAIEYYKLASDKGNGNAAFNLAVMAMKGEGMQINLSLAKQWGLLAEQRGNPRASGLLVMINYGLETERMEAEVGAAAFQKPFFKSKDSTVEDEYSAGVKFLQRGDMNSASRHFAAAAKEGHTSAYYNLSILWGSGAVTPYDFDAAADCWYKAAAAGHPKAQESIWLLEAADRGGFGSNNLAALALKQGRNGNVLQSEVMVCAARFFDVICKKYGATNDVISYELDAAATSDWSFIHDFVKRTGVDKSFYDGGLDRLTEGSAADQVTDGLNEISVAMSQAGYDQNLVVMARCSIVGYIVLKSPYGNRSEPLRGVDTFFS